MVMHGFRKIFHPAPPVPLVVAANYQDGLLFAQQKSNVYEEIILMLIYDEKG